MIMLATAILLGLGVLAILGRISDDI